MVSRFLATSIAVLAFSGAASAACEFTVESTDSMTFSTTSMEVPSDCEKVTVTLKHTGKLAKNIMGHNWVLTAADDLQMVATESMSAGLENDYLLPDDARVIAATAIIGGGDEATVSFSINELDKDASYAFFCSFPGHWAVMKGTFKIV